jgi:isopenicillin N synthase-like dioxygenase
VEYIQLANLDLSKFDDPISRKGLAKEFFTALTGTGFFTITNHGISKEEWDQQMDLAHAVMTLSPEEKKPYEGEQIIVNTSHHCLNCNQCPKKMTAKAYTVATRLREGLAITEQ